MYTHTYNNSTHLGPDGLVHAVEEHGVPLLPPHRHHMHAPALLRLLGILGAGASSGAVGVVVGVDGEAPDADVDLHLWGVLCVVLCGGSGWEIVHGSTASQTQTSHTYTTTPNTHRPTDLGGRERDERADEVLLLRLAPHRGRADRACCGRGRVVV